jgi:hypothetical protein
VLSVDVAKVDQVVAYIASVSEACYKRLFKMFYLFLDVCLQASVLCCSKCFHIASCKYFIWMLHMFHTRFKCMSQMFHLLQTYVAFKCFMFQRCVQRVMGA